MSTPPMAHADEWLDQKLTAVRRRFHQNLQELEQLNLRQIEAAIGNSGLRADLENLLVHHLLPRTRENMGTLLRGAGHPRPQG